MKMIKPLVNFAKIADSFDTFIFGYNGVISYGNGIIPSAAECLKNLAAMRKKIVIISNSNLRTLEIVEQLSTAQHLIQDPATVLPMKVKTTNT